MRNIVVGMAVVLCIGSVLRAAPPKVGDKAPDFKATNVDGKAISLADAKGAEAVVLCFTCNGCPVAVAYEDRFIEFAKKYGKKSVKFIALNVNNKTENLEKMKQRADEKGFNFPYAFDATAKSASAYGAKVTPHVFVLDKKGAIAYMGAFDNNMNAKKADKHYAADAVEALLAGKKPEVTEKRPFGCGLKIKNQ